MDILLMKWISDNKNNLLKKGITTDEIFATGDTVENPCSRVDQSNETYIARICAWRNGGADIEVLDINTGNSIFIKHVDSEAELFNCLDNYQKIMTFEKNKK